MNMLSVEHVFSISDTFWQIKDKFFEVKQHKFVLPIRNHYYIIVYCKQID